MANEWTFAFASTLLLLVVTSLPYVFAYLATPQGKVFMGVLLDVPDHEQYFAWMRDLSTAWLASNRLTPEPNRAVFFNLLWWLMGRIGGLLQLGIGPMYQLLRVASAFVFFAALSILLQRFVPNRGARRLTFGLIAAGSGLGWVLVVLKYTLAHGQLLFPLDVYIAEGNALLDVMAYPHFVAAASYILVFELVLRASDRKSQTYAWLAGALALFLGFQHAYDLILVYGVLGAYALMVIMRDRAVPRTLVVSLGILGGVSVWPALYSIMLTRLDPVWKGVLAQFSNAGVFSPNPLHLVVVMGIPFILAIGALLGSVREGLAGQTDKGLFVRAWLVANFLLLYIPTDYQVHMLNGFQIPVAILGVEFGMTTIVPRLKAWWPRSQLGSVRLPLERFAALGLLLLVLPTNVYLWSWRFVDLSRHDLPYFIQADEFSALEWLDHTVNSNDVIMSSLDFGQFVPAYTGGRVFLGHWAQTLDFYSKQTMVETFYSSGASDSWRIKLLEEYGVHYVILGEAEREIGDFDAASASYLQPAYVVGRVSIFRVQLPGSAASTSGKTIQ